MKEEGPDLKPRKKEFALHGGGILHDRGDQTPVKPPPRPA